MSYYACGYGDLILKENVTQRVIPDEVLDRLNNAFGMEFYTYPIRGDGESSQNISLSVDEKYDDDLVIDSLNAITPYIAKGCVYFTGEDDTHWRFIFNSETGEWNQENGYICYSIEDAYAKFGQPK